MKIVKIVFGVITALWAFGILLKFLRRLPLISTSPFGVSYFLGAVAGIIIFSLISYLLFKSAFKNSVPR